MTSDGAGVSHRRSMQVRHVGFTDRGKLTYKDEKKNYSLYCTIRTTFDGREVFVHMIFFPNFIQFERTEGGTHTLY
jgi:hypothetical protein